MTYLSTKTFGHELGLSAAFRQWRAESHCRFIHGYALAVSLVFATEKLNDKNWCVDFGGLKNLKFCIEQFFDHKLLVAEDDPMKEELCALAGLGLADVVVVEATGCEKFAEMIYNMTENWLATNGHIPRVRLLSVEVREHGANSALFTKG